MRDQTGEPEAGTEAADEAEVADVAVVGGGLGGLCAAGLLARRGLSVTLLERAPALGGRAATHEGDGFLFNLGAHALYRGGAAARVLADLGVPWRGAPPPAAGLAIDGDQVHRLPSTTSDLLRTGLLTLGAKVEGARLLAGLGRVATAPLAGVALGDWLARRVADEALRATLQAFFRLVTYTDAPARLSAGAAIAQLQLGQRRGVAYLDGGWQTLVDGAAAQARRAGAVLRVGAPVRAAEPQSGGGYRLRLDGARSLRCQALVLATGPAAAAALLPSPALSAWAAAAVPVKAACLDVALTHLPSPFATFALGIDRPLYLSVHSLRARLAPPGAALVSTMNYLPPGEPSDPARDRAELEALLDRLQPGWRAALVEARYLPAMVAQGALVLAEGGGLAGRPGPAVQGAPGAFVVGDWVGPEGLLLDGALASAEAASGLVAEKLEAAPAPRHARPAVARRAGAV